MLPRKHQSVLIYLQNEKHVSNHPNSCISDLFIRVFIVCLLQVGTITQRRVSSTGYWGLWRSDNCWGSILSSASCSCFSLISSLRKKFLFWHICHNCLYSRSQVGLTTPPSTSFGQVGPEIEREDEGCTSYWDWNWCPGLDTFMVILLQKAWKVTEGE